MSKPDKCPDEVHTRVLLHCWAIVPNERKPIRELKLILQSLLDSASANTLLLAATPGSSSTDVSEHYYPNFPP